MRHGFHYALVKAEGCSQQALAVAGGATAGDVDIGGVAYAFFHVLKHVAESLETVAGIAAVVAVNKFSGGVEKHYFRRCAARVHAEVVISRLAVVNGRSFHAIPQFFFCPAAVLFFRVEQWLQRTAEYGFLLFRSIAMPVVALRFYGLVERFERCGSPFAALRHYCTSYGRHEVRAVGHEAAFGVKLHYALAVLLEFGYEGERSAAEQHVRLYVHAPRQRRGNLHGDCRQHTCGDVGLAGLAGYEILYVGLREHAAARGDGVNGCGLARQFVEGAYLNTQQCGGLVDKGSRASCATAVHAYVGYLALGQEYHLRVLAANVHKGTHGGVKMPYRFNFSHHFLRKPVAPALRITHAYRACHNYLKAAVAHSVEQVAERGGGARRHVGVVAAVVGGQHVHAIVKQSVLQCRGTNVDAKIFHSSSGFYVF